jgi:hypothetical protein
MSIFSENHKFNWGDTLIIKKDVPPDFHPGEVVSVCSVIKMNSDDVKKFSTIMQSNWMYIVEFGDGNSIELPEDFLEKY